MAKFCKKTKIPKFRTKNALFGYFWAKILKHYCHIWNQHPQICQIAKFREKTKMPKFGIKNALFGYFWARILENYCVIYEISTLNFVKLQNFAKKQKCLNLGRNKTYFSIFLPRTRKCYCRIWNQHPQICQMIKFLKKNKNA